MLHQAARSVIETSFRLLQPENAEPPMVVTPSGMVMLLRLLQPENAR